MKKIGERVVLNTLVRKGDFLGTIIDIEPDGLCTVKLDCQENPINRVLYYDERPYEVKSRLWQICYPEDRKEGKK